MHFVKNTLAANLEMVPFIANKFFSVLQIWPIAKSTLSYQVFCDLVGSVATRLTDFSFEALTDVDDRLKSENFVGMLAWFNMACERRRSHSRRILSQGELSLVPDTIISLIRVLKGIKFTLGTFSSVTKSWNLWPSCFLYVKT